MYEGSLAPFFCRTDFVRGASALLSTHTAGCGKARKNIGRRGAVLWKKTITCRHERDRARKTQGAGRIGQIRRFVRVERRHAPQPSGRCGQHGGVGHLPLLHGRRTLRLAAEDHAHQRLHLRLRLLHQPPQQRHPARRLHSRRADRADDRVFPPQLHRGAVPLVGRRPQSRLHDGAHGPRGPRPAHGAPLQRLYPPEKHSRGQSRTRRRGRALCRPHERQYRDPHRTQPAAAGSRQELREHLPPDELHPAGGVAERRGAYPLPSGPPTKATATSCCCRRRSTPVPR